MTFLELDGEVIVRCDTCDRTTRFPRLTLGAGDIVRCQGCGNSARYEEHA